MSFSDAYIRCFNEFGPCSCCAVTVENASHSEHTNERRCLSTYNGVESYVPSPQQADNPHLERHEEANHDLDHQNGGQDCKNIISLLASIFG
jgi:hypothetical protein